MPKALIILAEGFEEIEAVTPIDLLRRANINVTVAGLSSLQVQGARGRIKIIADTTLDKISDIFDIIILPGGMPGAENLSKSDKLKTILLNMHKTNKLIAAICAAPAVVLAPLGILNNKKATCFPGMENLFSPTTIFKEEAVVIDGNIITSRGAGTAFEFSLALIEILAGKQTRDQIAQKTAHK